MQRLLDRFATLFDLEQQQRPDWGTRGPGDRYESESGRSLDFYYAPHLFPEMELSLRLAHKLQFYMLPREVPPAAPMSVAAVLESYCHLSGDLFGWEMLADGRFLIWIVDLSGHGVPSGLSSAVLKVFIDNLRQRGRVGLLGMFPDRRYTATGIRLEPGDTMLLYTDGLVEASDRDGKQFGLDRVRGFLRSEIDTPRSLTDSLYRAIAEHQNMDKLEDDLTIVAAQMGRKG